MFKDRKKLIILIVVALVVVGLTYWWMINRGRISVKVAEVTKGKVSSFVSASGMVEVNTVEMGSKLGGRIIWLGVKEGDWVQKGYLLAKLDGYEQALKDYKRMLKLSAQGFVTEQQVDSSRLQLSNFQVVAPQEGLVLQKFFEVGEVAVPGQVIITVGDPRKMWVEVQIDEVDIGDIWRGQKVNITSDAYPDQVFPGVISWVAQEAELKKIAGRVMLDEEDKIFRAKINVLKEQSKLKRGMTIYADMIVKEKKGVLIIPNEAIWSKEGKSIIFAIERGRAREKEVTLGIRDSLNVEVIKGLDLGQKVAISNLDKLKNRGRVKIAK